eukprot:1502576-Prymnesium_polylepis.1
MASSSPARGRPPSLRRRWGNLGGSTRGNDDEEARCPLWTDAWSGTSCMQAEVLDEEVHLPMLRALQAQCVEPFDELAHGSQLEDLWRAAGFPAEWSRLSERWICLGFQTDDPARDLRGAGAIGLRQLLRFCRSGGVGVTRRITSQRTTTHASSCFPLAAASLNVTLMLCSHFRLVTMAGGAGAVA